MNAGGAVSWLWARHDIRRRWRSLVLLGLLAGITAGLVIASYDGARRTGTALHRLRVATAGSDAVVFASQSSSGVAHPDWSLLAERPEVKRLGVWGLVFGELDGNPNGGPLFAPADDVWGTSMDAPIVLEGRMFDPKASNEMVVDENVVRAGQAKLGQVLHFTAAGSDADFDSGVFTGPTTDLTVVGVVRYSGQFLFATDGTAMLSPGYLATYGSRVDDHQNAFVELRDVPDAIGQLRRDANNFYAGAPVLDENVVARRVQTTTGVERIMLIALAIVIMLAGLVLVGQAVTRSAAAISADSDTLRAMGMSRTQLVIAAIEPHVITALVAIAVAAATAIVASRWFPVGLAARIDPSRGIRVDVVLVVLGVIVLAALVLGAATVAALQATRLDLGSAGRASTGAAHWLRGVRPVTVRLGATMAYDVGARRSSSVTRPALIGSVAAMVGIVGALTLDHGLTRALANPQLAGVAWDIDLSPDYNNPYAPIDPTALGKIESTPGVGDVGIISRRLFDIDGTGVPTYGITTATKGEPVSLASISGRAPATPDEIALGPATAKALGVGIGDSVHFANGAAMTVVGKALFPTDVHSTFDEGAWLTPQGFAAVDAAITPPGAEVRLGIRVAPDASTGATIAALGTALGEGPQDIEPSGVPPELSNLTFMKTLPNVLAAFLAILGVAAVGHVLFTTVRRRAREFAVLRALGVTRPGLRAVVAAYGSAIAIAGVVVGVPLGYVLGRAGWRGIADRVPLAFESPLALFVAVLVVPVTLVIANLLAIVPGWRASRLQPAQVLRNE